MNDAVGTILFYFIFLAKALKIRSEEIRMSNNPISLIIPRFEYVFKGKQA